MGDSSMTNSYMRLAYDIEKNRPEGNAHPALRRYVDTRSEYRYYLCMHMHAVCILLCLAGIRNSSGYASNCTVTYSEGNVFVSCLNSSSVRIYQVVLLQQQFPNSVFAVNVSSGDKVNVPGVLSGKYCVLEFLSQDNEPKVRYSNEFNANTPPGSGASKNTICK